MEVVVHDLVRQVGEHRRDLGVEAVEHPLHERLVRVRAQLGHPGDVPGELAVGGRVLEIV